MKDVTVQGTENVTSFEKYRPSGKTFEVALTFSGEAGELIRQLMADLQADNPNEVAVRAISLLGSAQGKEILLKDPKTGQIESVEI